MLTATKAYHILFDVLDMRPVPAVPYNAADYPEAFQLLDDDGVLYFLGVATEQDFEPLDWARERFGCTEIRYRDEDGEWVRL